MEQMSRDERLAAQNECQVLKLLNHPNIIEYYENFLEDKALMIAMEYAPGKLTVISYYTTPPIVHCIALYFSHGSHSSKPFLIPITRLQTLRMSDIRVSQDLDIRLMHIETYRPFRGGMYVDISLVLNL